MTASRGRAIFTLCLVSQGCLCWVLGVAARSGCSPSAFVAGLALCFVPYAGVLAFSRSLRSQRDADLIAIVTALLFGAAFLFSPPLLSDDLYRYLWEGRLWLEGHNPYRLSPGDPALGYLRDDVWTEINNKSLASIYPPLSQLLFVIAQWLGGGILTVKLLALLGHVLCVAVTVRIFTVRHASLALALNPLLLSESALNGHFDTLCGVMLLFSAWALASDRSFQAGLAACAAVGLKIIGLVLLPILARRPKALVSTAFVSALLLVPLVSPRLLADPASGLGQFAIRWRGNESAFAVVDQLSRQLFTPAAANEATPDLAARSIVVIIFLGLCAWVAYRRLPPMQGARALVWALLILSPQVHPWYLGWLLPLEIAAGGVSGLIWSAAVLGAYVPLEQWLAEGVWEMPPWLQTFEYLAVALALILDPRRPSFRQQPIDRQLSEQF